MTNVAKAFPCLVCLWAFCAAAPAEEPVATVVLADFEKGRDGFEASLVRDPAVARDGQASGRIDADFTNAKAEPWKIVGAPLLYTNEIRAVRFWVRSHDAGGLTFRVIDSSGQVHQLRPRFRPSGEWQQVVLDSFEKGPGYQSWGGAKDHKFHWPARRLAFIFEKNNLPEGKVAGSLWIDQVELDLAGKPATVLDGCETVVLEDFESALKQRKKEDRLSGLAQDVKEFKGGAASGRFEGDFTKEGGQPWRQAGRQLDVVREFRRIRFWVRSADVKSFTFILTDKTGQAHHQSVSIEPDGQWQQVAIDAFDTGPGYRHFGGANDGRFHWPAKGIGFVIGKGDAKGPVTRTLWIDDIEALAEPGAFVPDLEMEQDRLGNVFLTTETVRIPLVSKGDRIEWTVRDFWHRQIERGVAVVRDSRAVIEPQAGRKGYFEVYLVVRKGDLTLAETDTSYAVITPVDVATWKDSPFGVMTHFAQGWELDIMPLIAKAGITSIRDEQYWQQIEKNKEEFVFASKFTDWMAEAAKFHIDPLVPMTFANKNYDEGLTPHTPEGCKAYGRYGQELLKKYGRQIRWLEIWNEYNGTWCKGPAADDRPKYYTQMLKFSYEAIKEVRPDVQVLGGAAVLLPRPYFEGIFKHGGMKYMDGVVIHPYRPAPEGVEEEIRELKDLMRKYNDGQTKPIWVTETGAHDKTPHGRHNVARYLVRMYTLLLSEECEKIYWYLLRDYSSFKTMGLLRDPNDPMGRYAVAPPYPAYANLIRQLSGAKFVRREPTDPRTRIYLFEKGGEPVRVCWATVPAHLALSADAPLTVTDLMGEEQRLEPVEGKVYLTLTENAVYVKGEVKEILPAGGRFVLPAEQTADILGDVTLKFSVDNRGGAKALEGVFEAHGQKANIACPAGAARDLSLTIPGEDTQAVDTREYAYRLVLDGKTAGLGQVTLHVVDPLTFSPDAKVDAARGMELRLANASSRTAYDVESVSWKVGDAPPTVQATAVRLPASKDLRFGLPLADLPDYRTAKVSASVKLKGRDAMLFSDEVSCNPCYRRTVRADGDLGDWDHAPAIDLAADGEVWPPVVPAAATTPKKPQPPKKAKANKNAKTQPATQPAAAAEPQEKPQPVAPPEPPKAPPPTGKVWFAWDAENFYLAARIEGAQASAGSLRFGLAAADSAGLIPAWYELRLAPDAKTLACAAAPTDALAKALSDVPVAVRAEGDAVVYETAVPWSRLEGIRPADKAFRFALVAAGAPREKGATPMALWGRGLYPGKEPRAFRLCTLEGAAGAAKPAGEFAATVEAQAKLPQAGQVVRILADSQEDFTNVQGKGHWHYGYFPGTGDGAAEPYTVGDFREMKYVETMWGYEWAGPVQFLKLLRNGGHPQAIEGRQAWSVRRWKSDVDGTVRVSLTAAGGQKQSDGIGAKVLVDGVVVDSRLIGGPNRAKEAHYDLTIPVRKGTVVDFAITCGPALNTNFDATKMTVRIALLAP